jgi:opacity protein-like surface antigen
MAEFGLFNSHAKGVDFSTFEASLRGSAPVSSGLEGIYYGGLDFNYYIPENETERRSTTGFHVGAGAMMQVTDSLWLRGDLKFMGGPGSSLLMLFGILFK